MMRAAFTLTALLLAVVAAAPSRAADAPADNVIEQLQQKLDSGALTLDFSGSKEGYLVSLLKALNISPDSQLLVFSASSLQFDRISQKTPRALYYQDNVAVGTVQNGRFIEIIAQDRKTGVAFYTLDIHKADKPEFVRRTSECLGCHGFATRWAPGMMVASYDTGPNGQVLNLDPNNLFFLTDDRTPFDARYGGWYVTGQTGAMKHRGNVTFDPAKPGDVPPGGLNIASLADRIDTSRYLEPGSDIVSLLTLEHQAGLVNLVAQINGQYASLDKGTGARVPAKASDIEESITSLVAYMTFADEVPLPSPVKGSSTFTGSFAAQGPHDGKDRGLRQFDLNTRLFRYPLSYMIYSQAFDDLDRRAKDKVYRRLYDALSGTSRPGDLAMLKDRDGAAAINILAATKKGLPDFWQPVRETASGGLVHRR